VIEAQCSKRFAPENLAGPSNFDNNSGKGALNDRALQHLARGRERREHARDYRDPPPAVATGALAGKRADPDTTASDESTIVVVLPDRRPTPSTRRAAIHARQS